MHDHMTLQADQILLKIFYIIKTIFLNLCHMTRRKIQKYYSYYFCFCYFQSWTILDSNLTLKKSQKQTLMLYERMVQLKLHHSKFLIFTKGFCFAGKQDKTKSWKLNANNNFFKWPTYFRTKKFFAFLHKLWRSKFSCTLLCSFETKQALFQFKQNHENDKIEWQNCVKYIFEIHFCKWNFAY